MSQNKVDLSLEASNTLEEEVKKEVVRCLLAQGFEIGDGRLRPPHLTAKSDVRQLHELAVEHRKQRSRAGLYRHEAELRTYLADGSEVDPRKIVPRLVPVLADSKEELLFRYGTLHWSIPVSSGYGRRLRFLVMDDYNKKLIGLIGLGDPVFALKGRDAWVGWDLGSKKKRLRNVMDAFVLGAVPPYNQLLCGKLVALLVSSTEVATTFTEKYSGKAARISGLVNDAELAMVTTTSALGRSSVYNRLAVNGKKIYIHAGFTAGSGDFQFMNGSYDALLKYATEHCQPTAKQQAWGGGFRNRREVLKKTLGQFDLDPKMLQHGIKREIFVVPLGRNTAEFLKGEAQKFEPSNNSVDDLWKYFRERWLIARADRNPLYKEYQRPLGGIWN